MNACAAVLAPVMPSTSGFGKESRLLRAKVRILQLGRTDVANTEEILQALRSTVGKEQPKRRYTLEELFQGATPERIAAYNEELASALEGGPDGDELG